MSEIKDQLAVVAANAGIGDYQRHIFLCTGPKCCTPEVGLAAWDVLKKTLKDNGLESGPNACYRTKVGCLRICRDGPTMVVYPEGTWYHGMTPAKIPEFVQRHIVNHQPIADWIFAHNPLPNEPGTEVE